MNALLDSPVSIAIPGVLAFVLFATAFLRAEAWTRQQFDVVMDVVAVCATAAIMAAVRWVFFT